VYVENAMNTHETETLEIELQDLARTLAQVSSAGEMSDFLHGILTPRERENIALRWKLVKLLETGKQQRVISEELGVSLCKITRGSRELKKGPEGFRKIVNSAAANG
jgi:TrpR family trp operon transcriptional repressor